MIPTMFAISVTYDSNTGTRSPTLLSSGDKFSCCQDESCAPLMSALGDLTAIGAKNTSPYRAMMSLMSGFTSSLFLR